MCYQASKDHMLVNVNLHILFKIPRVLLSIKCCRCQLGLCQSRHVVDTQTESVQVLVGQTTICSMLSSVDISPAIKPTCDHHDLVPDVLMTGQIHCHIGIWVCHSENWCMGDQFILHQIVISHRVISFRKHFGVLPHDIYQGDSCHTVAAAEVLLQILHVPGPARGQFMQLYIFVGQLPVAMFSQFANVTESDVCQSCNP